ncbi:hypothetical protein [Sinorhizobium chiapasense]|uniref:Uncharacterized protein n=1 Tax=Sinorhizobium chiapasense TaxID=501572 RepID=A0ABZ2BA49_9HYPH
MRVAAARWLREHHIWETVRLVRDIPDLAVSDDAGWPSRRFRELVAASALVDAVIHLTNATTAKLCLRSVSHEQGLWTCSLRYAPSIGGRVTFKARHPDLAGAILVAFLRSCRIQAAPVPSDIRPNLPM